ncbi:hypothetical protein RI367_003196 [Sorochytrium milnesiophthora]
MEATTTDAHQALADIFTQLQHSAAPDTRTSLVQRAHRLLVHQLPSDIPRYAPLLLPLIVDVTADVRLAVVSVVEEALQGKSLTAVDKANLGYMSLAGLAQLTADGAVAVAKKAVTCIAIMAPLIFRRACTEVQFVPAWQVIMGVQASLGNVLSALSANDGLRMAAIKLYQSLVLTLSENSDSEADLSDEDDISLSALPAQHPVLVRQDLQQQGSDLLDALLRINESHSASAAVIACSLNALFIIAKRRSSMLDRIVRHLCAWQSWAPPQLTQLQQRSLERSLKNLLLAVIRLPNLPSSMMMTIGPVLLQLGARVFELPRPIRSAMQVIAQAKEQEKRDRASQGSSDAAEQDTPSKRLRTEYVNEDERLDAAVQERIEMADAIRQQIDILKLPLHVVIEMVVQSLAAIPQAEVDLAIIKQRTKRPVTAPQPSQEEQDGSTVETTANTYSAAVSIDYDDASDGDDSQPFYLNIRPAPDLESELPVTCFKKLLYSEALFSDDAETGAKAIGENPGRQMWMRTTIRLLMQLLDATTKDEPAPPTEEPTEPKPSLRDIMLAFIGENFKHRAELALLWMYEEYNLGLKTGDERQQYDALFCKLLKAAVATGKLEQKDKDFVRVVVEAPRIPPDALTMLKEYSETSTGYLTGIMALRELVDLRPNLRMAALDVLLELCTHTRKQIRAIAILATKSFYPENNALTPPIRKASLAALHKLTERQDGAAAAEGEDASAAVAPAAAKGTDDEAALEAQVTRYLDFPFALCAKVHGDVRDSVPANIQRIMRLHIQNLIRAIGPSTELLAQLREFPEGADMLAMQILRVLTDKVDPPAEVVDTVRHIFSTRTVSPKFLLFVLRAMGKDEVVGYVPQLMTLLDGTENGKNLVKGVITRLCDAQTSGGPAMTPADLLVQLHLMEETVGLRVALEATQICFSLSSIFSAQVLSVAIQQLFNQPKLPTLFMRTMIQAVTLHSSLQAFTVGMLGRLVARHIWEQPKLWQGFVRCVQSTQPASFAVLFQLAPEQFADVLAQAPALKQPLRQFAESRALSAQAQLVPLLALLAPDQQQQDSASTTATAASEAMAVEAT